MLTLETGVELEKDPLQYASGGNGFHVNPVFFFNVFRGDKHFDPLIIGLC